ncbi:AraC family transcriptional regulator [Paenibacillus sp. FSL H8-0548]|uniref:AraC family transcriptional regulator n=1 Tax=Paenibacillus sp. FSL H8-0548 TaxID=1920422 RepID=UPI00096EB076|nr:AraC family transcriptional regulator [Paenibacillus sp. FSL H8-0548]OMF38026.1 AraC family transcriptional regulator [Paenibacillus sp. FSL H8-0548]
MQEYDYEFADFIFYTPGDLDKEGRIWPVRAGRCLAKPNYKVGPKRIECYSLHFVQEGGVRLEYEGKQVELQKDDMFCLFPGRTYFYDMLPSGKPLQMSWLAVDGDRARSLLELAGVTEEEPFRKKAVTARVKASADQVIHTLAGVQRWNPAVALELQSLVCALFAGLIPETAPAPAAELAGWIHECMKYIELHALEGISVQQVADFAGVHRSYFTQVFTSQAGMPPMKYIQKIRMDKARRLLIDTDATITEIALSLGYPNLYTFTRAFKIYYKQSPLTLRKTIV